MYHCGASFPQLSGMWSMLSLQHHVIPLTIWGVEHWKPHGFLALHIPDSQGNSALNVSQVGAGFARIKSRAGERPLPALLPLLCCHSDPCNPLVCNPLGMPLSMDLTLSNTIQRVSMMTISGTSCCQCFGLVVKLKM